jgi:DNA-binding XRE family transcriptional regulator
MPNIIGKYTNILHMPILLGNLFYLYANKFSIMNPKEIPSEHQKMMIEIGKRLRELRKSKDMSYIEFAKKNGISRNSYNQMELGISNFQFISLLVILKEHGIGLEIFFKDL